MNKLKFKNALKSFDDFLKIDIRKGTIVDAKKFPEAKKPAYKLWIDFGKEIGIKKSSAQITENYDIEGLIGIEVLAVINLKPRQIGPFLSEVLTLGFSDKSKNIILLQPSKSISNGER